MPVSKRVTISNAEGASQLLIPTSERFDTGIYTIQVKNIVGQDSFSIEMRVTGQITHTQMSTAVQYQKGLCMHVCNYLVCMYVHVQ